MTLKEFRDRLRPGTELLINQRITGPVVPPEHRVVVRVTRRDVVLRLPSGAESSFPLPKPESGEEVHENPNGFIIANGKRVLLGCLWISREDAA